MDRADLRPSDLSSTNHGARLSLPIEGMSCASCVGLVETALRLLPGVAEANVNLATGRASIAFSGAPDPAAVARAVAEAGYTVPDRTTEIGVGGMTCASCVSHVEQALARVPGVTSASVNLATGRATIRHPGGTVGEADLRAAVEQAGYEVGAVAADAGERESAARQREKASLRRDLMVAFVLSLPLFAVEMGSHLIPALHDWIMGTLGMRTSWTIQAILASLMLFGPGLRFLRKGVPALLRGRPDMNSLVALGTSAAYGYSLVATFLPGLLPAGTVNVYYEASAVIVFLILLGRYLEARAKGRTSDAIRRLVALAPSSWRSRARRSSTSRVSGASAIRPPAYVADEPDPLRAARAQDRRRQRLRNLLDALAAPSSEPNGSGVGTRLGLLLDTCSINGAAPLRGRLPQASETWAFDPFTSARTGSPLV